MSLDNLKIQVTNLRVIEGNSEWSINRTIHIFSDLDFNNLNGFYNDNVVARCNLNIQKKHDPVSYCMNINIFNRGSDVVTLHFIKIVIDNVFIDNNWKVSEKMFIFPGQSINIPFAVKPVLRSHLGILYPNTVNITIVAIDKNGQSLKYVTSISNDHPDYQSPNSAISLWKDSKTIESNIKNGTDYVTEENIRQIGNHCLKNRKNEVIASASLLATASDHDNIQKEHLSEIGIQEVGPIITFETTPVIESSYIYNLSGDTRKTTIDANGSSHNAVIYTLNASRTGSSIFDRNYARLNVSFETRGIAYDKKIWYEVWCLNATEVRATKRVDNLAGDPDYKSVTTATSSDTTTTGTTNSTLLYKDTFIINNNTRKYTKSYNVDDTILPNSQFLLKVFWNKQVWNISTNTTTTTDEIGSLSQYADRTELVHESATRLYIKFNESNYYFETENTSVNGEFGKSINDHALQMFREGLILDKPLYIIRYVGVIRPFSNPSSVQTITNTCYTNTIENNSMITFSTKFE